MSLTGTGSFGNYDLTARTTGSPLDRQTTRDHEEVEEKARAKSVADVSDRHASPSEKDGGGGDGTDTAVEDDEDAIEQERRHSIVQALARKYTAQSQAEGKGVNPFHIASDDKESPLNPNGPNFSARAWAKAVVDMATGEGHRFRTAGVAFQNLNVYGFGSPTDFQKDVLNVWLEAVGFLRRITGHGKRRIDILRGFDGLVRQGEMLVVLGPPGSGCTTFLKTIAGDFNGIYVDENSYFNYQGKSENHQNPQGVLGPAGA